MIGRGGQWQQRHPGQIPAGRGVAGSTGPWGNNRTEPDDSLIIIDMMCSIHYTDYLL